MSTDDVQQDLTDTIVLIHGLWMTALSWEHWIAPAQGTRGGQSRC
jgi:hypothetical protein